MKIVSVRRGDGGEEGFGLEDETGEAEGDDTADLAEDACVKEEDEDGLG